MRQSFLNTLGIEKSMFTPFHPWNDHHTKQINQKIKSLRGLVNLHRCLEDGVNLYSPRLKSGYSGIRQSRLFTGIHKFLGQRLDRASYYLAESDTTTGLWVYTDRDSYMQMTVSLVQQERVHVLSIQLRTGSEYKWYTRTPKRIVDETRSIKEISR